MRPKKPESISVLSLSRPGRNSLSCTTPCLMPAFLAARATSTRVLEGLGGRLLAIDVLAGRDRLVQQLGAQLGRGGIEEQSVLGVLERGIEVGGPARRCRAPWPACASFASLRPTRIGSGMTRSPLLQRHAALGADRHDRADQVLVHAHAAGDAVHDDAETLLRHFSSLSLALHFDRHRDAQAARASSAALLQTQ